MSDVINCIQDNFYFIIKASNMITSSSGLPHQQWVTCTQASVKVIQCHKRFQRPKGQNLKRDSPKKAFHLINNRTRKREDTTMHVRWFCSELLIVRVTLLWHFCESVTCLFLCLCSRCTCWRGPTWMSSSWRWGSSLNVSSSRRAWPRLVLAVSANTLMHRFVRCIDPVFVCLFSTPTLWRTCWTSGGCSAPGSSGNRVFSTEETTSKTSAGWAESSAKSWS